MGKLKDLWAELKNQKDGARREEIQQKINGIEKWMIENNIGSIKEITNWNNTNTKSKRTTKLFGFEPNEFVHIGQFIIPIKKLDEYKELLNLG